MKRTFLHLTLAAIAMTLISASVAQAQRGGGRGFGGGFGGAGGFGGGGPLSLVSRDDVRQELGLTEKQVSEIEGLEESARESRRDLFGGFQGLRDASREEREQAVARMRDRAAEVQKQQRAQVEKVLNSAQRSRFAQLEFQFSLRRGSVQGALDAAGIDMSDSDRQKLAEAREEINRRTEEQIAKIRRDAQNEVLATVVSEKQIEKMTGEPFEFAAEQRRFGRGGRGGGEGGGREERARRRPSGDGNDSDNSDSGTRRRSRR